MPSWSSAFDPPSFIRDSSDRVSKLKQLMNHSWFSRVWVIQEAGLAKECHLMWGDHTMSIAELIEFACFCDQRSNTRLLNGNDQTLSFWRIVFICVYRTYNNADSWICSKPLIRSLYEKLRESRGLFLDVLQIGKTLSASDPRDHIYAFLGNPLAVSDAGMLIIEPDYDQNEKDVYFDTACALLRSTHESPYVLCFVHQNSRNDVTGTNGPHGFRDGNGLTRVRCLSSR